MTKGKTLAVVIAMIAILAALCYGVGYWAEAPAIQYPGKEPVTFWRIVKTGAILVFGLGLPVLYALLMASCVVGSLAETTERLPGCVKHFSRCIRGCDEK